MKGNLDFGTATVRDTKSVKQIWNKDKPRIVPDARYAGASDAIAAADAEIFVALPIRTVSLANMREHWTKRSARAQVERDAVNFALCGNAHKFGVLSRGCVVTLTRIAPRRLDSDNLPGSMKTIRDTIAVALFGGRPGQKDSDEAVEWVYAQASLGRNYGVTISIRKRIAANGGPASGQ